MTTLFVIVYEAYLVFTLSSFEPFVFFAGLVSYWGLLYNGLSAEEQAIEEETFPETTMNPEEERAMLEDESIMSEWSDLLTRKWKATDDDAKTTTEDDVSIMSRSSRFNEEEETTSSEEEEDEDLGFDPETLESYLAQYDQIKKDAQLAKELQLEEQKARDINNPFLVKENTQEDKIPSSENSKEEWKVRIFPRSS